MRSSTYLSGPIPFVLFPSGAFVEEIYCNNAAVLARRFWGVSFGYVLFGFLDIGAALWRLPALLDSIVMDTNALLDSR